MTGSRLLLQPIGLPLIDYALARATDPATSHEAAATFRPGTLPARILETLRQQGPLAEHEVAAFIGRERVSVSPRFAQLRDKGLVRATGMKINPATNKHCQVWEIAP